MQNLFEKTSRITFELSNVCNLSDQHSFCPLSLEREIKYLPLKVIYSVLEFLKSQSYSGMIALHNYNEPMIDPRLFKIIELIKGSCPDSEIYFSTNGKYLSQQILDELTEAGLSNIHISAYSTLECVRIDRLNFKIKKFIEMAGIDEKLLSLYDSEVINSKKPCFAPLNEIIITRDAKIGLCCRDWKRTISFGEAIDLKSILERGSMQIVYSELSAGDRNYEICKRCNISR